MSIDSYSFMILPLKSLGIARSFSVNLPFWLDPNTLVEEIEMNFLNSKNGSDF